MSKRKSKTARNADPNLAKILKEKFEPLFYPIQRILKGINNRSKDDQNAKFDDLYTLLHNEYLLLQALGNIRPNKGSSTPGVDFATLNTFSMNKVKTISQQLKDEEYKFKPVKRIYIPKPGKSVKRPLGIPTLNDRIVQEAIRIILEAIYEPAFSSIKNQNYGFRPGKSCGMVLDYIQKQGTACTYAVEGDIKGAYDNVNIDILISILRKKIKDNKFLSFIKQGCHSGLLDMGKYKDTFLGVPQGGICSPILFNIYMHEFDLYINYKLNSIIERYNIMQKRETKPLNPEYKKLNGKIYYYNKRIGELSKSGINKKSGSYVKGLLNEKRALVKLRLNIPSIFIQKRNIRILYARYADDWILLTNSNKRFANLLKKHIGIWLNRNLGLQLSSEKTKVTNISTEFAKFLGFSIKTYNKPKITISAKERNLIRTGQSSIKIGIDLDRVLDRLQLHGFCNNKYKPIAKRPWTVLPIREIIFKYNAILSGKANYFIPVIDNVSSFSRIQYILEYSCYATLATKLKSSIYKIMKNYGKPPTFTVTMQSTDSKGKPREISKRFQINSYLTNKKNALRLKQTRYQASSDLFKPMTSINWRTYKNLNAYCAICGTDKDIEWHHVNSLRSGSGQQKTKGFNRVLSQLNRKQIPLCKAHHIEITKGRYNDIKTTDLISINYFLS